MIADTKYGFMSRKELAVAGSVSERTLYEYINGEIQQLKEYGYKKRKKLNPMVVRYICENFGISL